MHNIKNFLDARLDVVHLLARKCFLKKFLDSECKFITRNNLSRRCDRHILIDIDRTRFDLQVARDHPEDRTLARAILTHERYLRSLAHRKIRLSEDRLTSILKGHIVETDDNVGVRHVFSSGSRSRN